MNQICAVKIVGITLDKKPSRSIIVDEYSNVLLVGIREGNLTAIVGISNIKMSEHFPYDHFNFPVIEDTKYIESDTPIADQIPIYITLNFEETKVFGRYIHILTGRKKDIDQLFKQGSIKPVSFYKKMSGVVSLKRRK